MPDKPNGNSGLFANPYLLLVIAPLFWGGNAVVGKLATSEWLPFTFSVFRWLCAAIILFPFAAKHLLNDRAIVRANIRVLLALGAVGMAGFNMLFYLALRYTTAVNVSIIQAVMPVFIIAANFLVFRQRVVALQSLGLILSILGVMIISTSGNPLTFVTGGLNRGDLIMLIASAFYAAYTFGLRWRPDIHWLSFMWMLALGAILGSLPFALWEMATTGFGVPSINGWWMLAYVMLFPTVLGQLAYAKGVSILGSNRASLFINLVPIFGSLLAVLVLREAFRWHHAAGLVMVVSGIMLAEYFAGRAATGAN
ncbi:MAG: DMT family transporter [Granulosicoccaceae bacterium]